MHFLIKWLNQPYPFDNTWKDNIKNAAYGGIFVFLFLVIFQPFGLSFPKGMFWKAVLICSYFGLVTTAVLILLGICMRYFPVFFKEKSWVIWKEILVNLLTILGIGMGNMLLAMQLFNEKMTWLGFLAWQGTTLSIGIFPILFTAYTKQQILQKRHRSGAAQLNTKLPAPEVHRSSPQQQFIQLHGDNQNEQYSFMPTDLLYIEAADNYVKVAIHTGEQAQTQLLRGSLKKMEAQLLDFPFCFRCHRTYVVNLNKVDQVSGNAQGYKLHLLGGKILIPVSRSLNKEIDRRMSHLQLK